jgi:trigger factor
VKSKRVTSKDIDDNLAQIAQNYSELKPLEEKRSVENGDSVVIDFEGFLDDKPFEGGKAEKYTLEIGSNSFIPGFEEQIIGMEYDEEKDINVTFPAEYQSKELAGKDVVFKIKLHEIKQKIAPKLDDEFAKKILGDQEDSTIDKLKEQIKEQLLNEKKAKYYMEELKPKFLENLVKNIECALPKSIVNKEVNILLNNKAKAMSEEKVKELQKDQSKVEELAKQLEPEAQKSVKATFIVDALAKAENIEVSDDEIAQILYYEALQTGQDPETFIKQYKDQGYLPAIKMSMIEEKVVTKLLDEKKGSK